MRKKDMYLNFNNPYSGKNKRGRRGYGRRGRRPNFFHILLILIIAIGLGFLAFYITNKISPDSNLDLFRKGDKKLIRTDKKAKRMLQRRMKMLQVLKKIRKTTTRKITLPVMIVLPVMPMRMNP